MKKIKIISFLYFMTVCFQASATTTLTAKTVLNKTFEKSLQAKSIKLDRDISQEDLREAKSQYDLNFFGELTYEKDESERNAPIMGTDTSTTTYNFGLNQLTPLGTNLTAGFYNTRATTDSAFAAANTLYDSRFYFGITQPLLYNWVGYQNRKTVDLAKKGIEQTISYSDSRLQGLAYQNLTYYWTWYLYSKLESISHMALSAAEKLYRTNKQKMAIGLIEESDIYAFEANVDIIKAELLDIQAKRATYEGELLSAIDMLDGKIKPGVEQAHFSRLPSVGSMISQAKQVNPEYLTFKHSLEVQNIVVAMKKNSRLPQVDLTASLTLNGLDPNYSSAFTDIGDGHPIWAGGVNVTYPLQNRQARANYNKEKFKQAQALFDLKDKENQIITQIQKGTEKFHKAKSRMHVIATAVKHQKLKWEGEIKKYDQGRSDPDVVIRYQNDYLDTQKLFVQSQVDCFLARLELDYNRGLLKP